MDKKNNFDNFIAKGSVSNFKSEIKKNLSFDNSSFNFFADKNDILLKNIIGNVGPIKISEGDLQIKLSKEVTLISNFKSIINYDKNFNTLDMFGKNLNNIVSIDKFTAEFYNYISINLDETYKLTKYNLKNNGKIIEAKINLEKSYKNFFNKEKIELKLLSNSRLKLISIQKIVK